MFPKANCSSAVVTCLRQAATKAGVILRTKVAVNRLDPIGEKGFIANCKDGPPFYANKVLLATGGHPSGRRLAISLGHEVVAPVPSLFTLALNAPWLATCSGIALNGVRLNLFSGDQHFEQVGRVLLTHRGISGPAVLRLSAFAARALHLDNYKAELSVNWVGITNSEPIQNVLRDFCYKYARRKVSAVSPFKQIPKRLWFALLEQVGLEPTLRWADLPSGLEHSLTKALVVSSYQICGRGPFGEEFVTAGGVVLGEVNLATMESRVCPGLYISGELLDVDGLTGGFNFQHCWSSGWLAGKAIANNLNSINKSD